MRTTTAAFTKVIKTRAVAVTKSERPSTFAFGSCKGKQSGDAPNNKRQYEGVWKNRFEDSLEHIQLVEVEEHFGMPSIRRLSHCADDLPSINQIEKTPKSSSKSAFVPRLSTAFGQYIEKPKG